VVAEAGPASAGAGAGGDGPPGEGYPFDWSVYQWLPGESANGTIADLEQAAVDLAGFVRALQKADVTGAHPRPAGGRGGPLAQHDEQVRRSVGQLADRVDREAILRSWQESLAAPAWDGPPVAVGGHRLRWPQRRRSGM
jgi:aminoglycoside phosphotransferase (APT) family kinase protein